MGGANAKGVRATHGNATTTNRTAWRWQDHQRLMHERKNRHTTFGNSILPAPYLPSPFHIVYNNAVCNCRTLTGAMSDIRPPWAALPAVADPRLRKITPCGRMPLRGFQAGSRYDMCLPDCAIGSIQNEHEKFIEDISIL